MLQEVALQAGARLQIDKTRQDHRQNPVDWSRTGRQVQLMQVAYHLALLLGGLTVPVHASGKQASGLIPPRYTGHLPTPVSVREHRTGTGTGIALDTGTGL